jgi:hypothetical protein
MTDNDLATSEGAESFTPEEQAAFEAYERGEESPAAAAAPVEAPEGAPAAGEAAAAAGEPAEAAGEGTEIDPNLQARDEKGKFVPHGAFHEERERRKAVEKELTDLREKYARGDERLRLLTEAARAQTAAPAPAAAEPPKVIDPKEDIFGAYDQLKAELEALKGGVQKTAEETRQEREFTAVRNDYVADLNRFQAQEPAFADAFRFIAQTRAAELKLLGHPEEQIPQLLGQEELHLAVQARQRGVSPAEMLFAVAKARGFAPKAAEPAPAPAPAAPAETPAQKAERVAAGQAGPGKSLSAAGGAPAGEVTLEMLGAMSEAEFEAFATKNPRKLARLMGEEA